MFFSKQQFISLCALQSSLQEVTVGQDWMFKDLDFGTAILVESGEACDHFGWKWWAQQNLDKYQAMIECVDILHFAFSGMIAANVPQGLTYEMCFDGLSNAISQLDEQSIEIRNSYNFIDWIKDGALAGVMGEYGHTIDSMLHASSLLGYDTEAVFKAYIGKNVLNRIRKANGYKEGKYIKTWFGQEDNVVLQEVMDSLDTNSPTFITDATAALEQKYSEVVATVQ